MQTKVRIEIWGIDTAEGGEWDSSPRLDNCYIFPAKYLIASLFTKHESKKGLSCLVKHKKQTIKIRNDSIYVAQHIQVVQRH